MIAWNLPTEFDWDGGNREKVEKHGVKIVEIEQAYLDKEKYVFFDAKHSGAEQRHIVIGKNKQERWIYTVMTIRKKRIRVISARYMHNKEVKLYEEIFEST